MLSLLRHYASGGDRSALPILFPTLDFLSWFVAALVALVLPWRQRHAWPVQVLVILGVTALLAICRQLLLFGVSPHSLPLWSAVALHLRAIPLHMMLIGGFVGAGYAIRFAREYARKASELDRLKRELTATKYRALKSQLRPEFLFGVLDRIALLLHRDPRRAQDAIIQLSDVLRTSLRTITVDWVSLKEEVEFTQRVVELEEIRSGQRRRLRLESDPELHRAWVPHLTLFSLVDATAGIESEIGIRIDLLPEDEIAIRVRTVAATGHRRLDQEQVDRLRERLDVRLDGEYELDVDEEDEDLVVLRIPLLLRRPMEGERPAAVAQDLEDLGADDRRSPRAEMASPGGVSLDILRREPMLFRTLATVWLILAVTAVLVTLPPMAVPYQVLHGSLVLATWLTATVAGILIAERFSISGSEHPRLFWILAAGAGVALIESLLVNVVPCVAPERACFDVSSVLSQQRSYLLYLSGIVSSGYALQLIERSRRLHLVRHQTQTTLRDADLSVLSMQLRPHFVFNVLNAILTHGGSDTASAGRLIALLRELLRRSFEAPLTSTVPLAEELDTLRLYLEIERERFPNRFEVVWQVDPGLDTAIVPHFILQPLVENAVQHGVRDRAESGRIWITAEVHGQTLVLTVRDNGRGASATPRGRGGGVGLPNVRARLQTLYGAHGSMETVSVADEGFRVRLRLPLILPDVVAGRPANAREDAAL